MSHLKRGHTDPRTDCVRGEAEARSDLGGDNTGQAVSDLSRLGGDHSRYRQLRQGSDTEAREMEAREIEVSGLDRLVIGDTTGLFWLNHILLSVVRLCSILHT